MAAMATVSMFLSPRDSTLSVNSEVGVGSPPAWRGGWALYVFDCADRGHRGNCVPLS